MTIHVYDYRQDIANVIVRPEIRSRFMRLEPGPAAPLHSHDLGGEIFLVLEGQCEFIVEEERITCGPGQLVYMEPRVRHSLHAAGDKPCVVYLSVTPHVEPTHTRYGDPDNPLPPVYGGWRGKEHRDVNEDRSTADLARTYAAAARSLAVLARENVESLEQHIDVLARGDIDRDQQAMKQTMDEMWLRLRDVLQQVSDTERVWNDLAPRGMPAG